MMRVGQGYDAHKFAPGRRLVLGGVEISYHLGLAAHSDGDVLMHAICDALLGAAGLRDIGHHFPDSSDEFKNVDSRILLRAVREKIRELKLHVGNLDATLVAQMPRLSPYIDTMRIRIAADLKVDAARVNVKATTTEGMGFTGRGEGIAAQAVVLLLED
ncbi:MAG: 2-C-methyl-D-erythritol 2,4-cyclodiphosphate synthase [Chromatiaceae bacterium]|nr:2-C-methyl-D-erythritol 2,4-cyclodiphosphate synthase [Gammaproteobacteria bacterium]MCB1905409.1 2-C-methyl-D-erythritol 2,4-cyclodiphosphate synthase [Gammaproteobacteria bacterium]MCP5448162.1 2-C-methyl-D-erythritol 2,4-cyclodiphosphate synthase [Chromatiaceae bacterium]